MALARATRAFLPHVPPHAAALRPLALPHRCAQFFTCDPGCVRRYIGMLEQIKKWAKDGWSGIVNLTG